MCLHRHIDGSIAGQSEPGSNGNEMVLHTIQSSITGTLPSDAVQGYTQDTPFKQVVGEEKMQSGMFLYRTFSFL